jgi:peptide/nickel transport system substrate-binding protein
MRRQSWKRRLTQAAVLLAVGGLSVTVAACGGGATSNTGAASDSSNSGPSGTATVEIDASGVMTDNFNPFSPDVEDPAKGIVYEPLFFFDTAKGGAASPWLATSYAWSKGGHTLTFSLRHGVKWTDGTPFTSADVVYTLDLVKNNSALNPYGLPITSVSADGAYKVVVNFSAPAYTELDYIAGDTYIVPEHIWKSKNAATWTNPEPVGTGAFEMSSFSGEAMTFTANPHYYLPGFPKLKTLRYLSYDSNTSADLALEDGQIDWAGSYVPNIQKAYFSKSKGNTSSPIPLLEFVLIPNMHSAPANDLKVREALSDALNRQTIGNDVYGGLAEPSNPESLIVPDFSDLLSPSLKNAQLPQNVSETKQLLESDGYTMGSNGFFEKDGHELTLTLLDPSPYTDYTAVGEVVTAEAAQAGINLVLNAESANAYDSDTDLGNFQFDLYIYSLTPDPYTFYNSIVGGSATPPIGTTDTAGDFGRYVNPTVDTLLKQIAGQQTLSSQLGEYYQIESVIAKNLPVIPLVELKDGAEYNANAVTGYPTPANPYASPQPYTEPDLGWVAMRLTAVS